MNRDVKKWLLLGLKSVVFSFLMAWALSFVLAFAEVVLMILLRITVFPNLWEYIIKLGYNPNGLLVFNFIILFTIVFYSDFKGK
jgi:hypothetical protein